MQNNNEKISKFKMIMPSDIVPIIIDNDSSLTVGKSVNEDVINRFKKLSYMPTYISFMAITPPTEEENPTNELFSHIKRQTRNQLFDLMAEIINEQIKAKFEQNNYNLERLKNMEFKNVNKDMFSNIKGSDLLVTWHNEENQINDNPSAEVFTDGKTRTRIYETLTGVHILTQDSKVKTVIPAIVKVKPINNRVVIVEFADGTQEKAVLAKEDTFSLEQGISICITKKLLSNIIGSGNGSSVYNKLIDYAIKKYEDDIAYEKELAEIEAKEKQAAEKKERKKKAKEKKQQDKYRQDYIDAICEAVVKAMSAVESKKE